MTETIYHFVAMTEDVAAGKNKAYVVEEHDIVEPVDATDIGKRFIDELEDSLAEDIRRDQLGN